MSIRSTALPLLDRFRGRLASRFDLRRYDVAVVVNTWTGGAYPGAPGAVKTTTTTPLLVDGQRPKVEQVSSQDVIASGGLYQEQDIRVGPLTPPFSGGAHGVDSSVLNPAGGSNVEVFYLVTGPGMDAGHYYKKIGDTIVYGNFRYMVVLRETAEQAV